MLVCNSDAGYNDFIFHVETQANAMFPYFSTTFCLTESRMSGKVMHINAVYTVWECLLMYMSLFPYFNTTFRLTENRMSGIVMHINVVGTVGDVLSGEPQTHLLWHPIQH